MRPPPGFDVEILAGSELPALGAPVPAPRAARGGVEILAGSELPALGVLRVRQRRPVRVEILAGSELPALDRVDGEVAVVAGVEILAGSELPALDLSVDAIGWDV